MSEVKPIPDGFHTITPHLVVKGADDAIAFYGSAFGAEVVAINRCDKSGSVLNAKLRIGDSIIMVNDEFPDFGCTGPSPDQATAVTIHLYVEQVDQVFDQAVAAGAVATMPVADMFWGDRFGSLKDPFGHSWSIGTHIEDLSDAEIAERSKHAFA